MYILVWALLLQICHGSRIEEKIYMSIKNYSPCILLTNATHQVGCTSDMNGNRGVLYVVSTDEDLDWLLNKGQHQPYVPLLKSSYFNEEVMKKLIDSKKVSGVLVIHQPNTPLPKEGFSPDSECPNDRYGMYHHSAEYGHCKKTKWNPLGNDMSKIYYGIPIFALTDKDEINAIIKCYNTHNRHSGNTPPEYPLCAVEIKDFMFATKDTPTCRRKTETWNLIGNTYCDPLGDNNIYGSLFPMVGEVTQDDIIMAAARLDSTAFFHDFAPAADNGVTGIVTLLAAAHALGDYKRYLLNSSITEKLKPIIFSFFNGEVWDYIGSSKMVYDMEHDNFPYQDANKHSGAKEANDKVWTSKFNLQNIGYFLELNQVGLGNKIYGHTDPLSMHDHVTKTKVTKLNEYLQNSTREATVDYAAVAEKLKQPLPPASFQRFLRYRSDIPGMVLTDHEKEYSNNYYNSRFDNHESVGLYVRKVNNDSYLKIHGPLVQKLTNLSQAVANTLYLLASDGVPPKQPILVPKNLTANLLYCLVFSANCPGFKEVVTKPQSLPNLPMSRYVSVLQLDNPITQIIHRLLAYYTGEWLPKSTCKGVKKSSLPTALSYFTVPGRGLEVCVRANTYMTQAVSPAFDLQDYDTTEYSTWAESMWYADIGVQMYLVASPTSEAIVITTGIAIFVVSFFTVFAIKKRADLLFVPSALPAE